MSNDHVHPTFQSLLSDIREATQTLANCAAKGALNRDGTRMPPQQRTYDSKCEDLAVAFLADHSPVSFGEIADLAQTIQDAIEDWFADRETRPEGDA